VSIDVGKAAVVRDEMSVDMAAASVHIAVLSIVVAETHVDVATTLIHTLSRFACNDAARSATARTVTGDAYCKIQGL